MDERELIDCLFRLRSVASPVDEPVGVLTEWRIFRAADASNHFVGKCTDNGLRRVSSAIVRFDMKTMAGVTRSGRLYKLEGPAGEGGDAQRAERGVARWALSYGVRDIRDVTDAFLEDPGNQASFTH